MSSPSPRRDAPATAGQGEESDSFADSAESVLEEVERLTWAAVDERVSASDLARLEKLLAERCEARQRYRECIQLQGDLQRMFGGASNPPDARPERPISPVLRNLTSLANQDHPTPFPDGDS